MRFFVGFIFAPTFLALLKATEFILKKKRKVLKSLPRIFTTGSLLPDKSNYTEGQEKKIENRAGENVSYCIVIYCDVVNKFYILQLL